jgi:hypothetical protein
MPDLTGLPALDVAIGLAFLYLLLSLFLSAIQEAIAGVLNWRATMLEEGIRNMLGGTAALGSTEAGKAAKSELYNSPFITALYRKTTLGLFGKKNELRLPSYIAPRTFARALFDTFAPDAAKPDGENPKNQRDIIKDAREAIEANGVLPAETKRALTSILDNARGNIDEFRRGVEQWFDDSMARVSGWYKRKAQIVLCVLAAALAVGLNIDSIVVARTLWKQPEVRAIVVQAATKPDGVGKAGKLPGNTPADRAANGLESVKKLNLPIGWSKNPNDPRHVSLRNHAAAKFAGWMITFIALSLGAPFWFDALSRLSRLRNSGKPEAPLPAPGHGLPGERVK